MDYTLPPLAIPAGAGEDGHFSLGTGSARPRAVGQIWSVLGSEELGLSRGRVMVLGFLGLGLPPPSIRPMSRGAWDTSSLVRYGR